MLVPPQWSGPLTQVIDEKLQWFNEIKQTTSDRIFCALWQRWPRNNLPPGYDLYIVSFHLETIDLNWIQRQSRHITSPIIILSDLNYYEYKFPTNVYCFTYYYLHNQVNLMLKWFKKPIINTFKKYKFSAVCNRPTQSKAWIVTKLLEDFNDQSLVALHPTSEFNVAQSWPKTNNKILDNLTEIFHVKYSGVDISIDNWNPATMNNQKLTGDPDNPLYTNTALHFTNETVHCSLMDVGSRSFIYPGPFLTEKTLKCLVAGCAFVPIGQFETYQTLKSLGFNFDYSFDTQWDLESDSSVRFERIIKLIEKLSNHEVNDVLEATTYATQFNQDHVFSGSFYQQCELKNLATIEQIVSQFS